MKLCSYKNIGNEEPYTKSFIDSDLHFTGWTDSTEGVFLLAVHATDSGLILSIPIWPPKHHDE